MIAISHAPFRLRLAPDRCKDKTNRLGCGHNKAPRLHSKYLTRDISLEISHSMKQRSTIMSQTSITCSDCREEFDIVRHGARRWMAAAIGAAVGLGISKNFVGTVLSGAASYAGVAFLDERNGRRCPNCGTIVWRSALRSDAGAGHPEEAAIPTAH
jgi:hypothetical protein